VIRPAINTRPAPAAGPRYRRRSTEEIVDITQLILDDHHEQRRLFAILEQVDSADTGTLEAVWARLSAFLEVHAAAEEEIFYPELLRVGMSAGRAGSAEEETLDAIHDHNDIRDAIAAVAGHRVGTSEWFAATAAVNLANGDHMAEEEREGLTDFRRRAGLQLRHELAVAFAAFEARHFAGVRPVDRDPEVYVREAERDIGARGGTGRPDGSLGIGNLGKGPA
jgi:Hemerythrin HHE cation binding domain